MKKYHFVLAGLFMASLLTLKSHARPKAIFGSDNRLDYFETPKRFQNLAHAMGSWTTPLFVEESPEGLELLFPKIGDEYGLCPDEKFREQPTSAISCTGFLVGPDLFMTAGHCMVNVGEARNEATPMCSDFKWLFDYHYPSPKAEILKKQPKDNLVGCENVIYAAHIGEGDQRKDFALIKLSRPLLKRPYFKLSNNSVHKGQSLFMMGFPSGLPLKFVLGSFVLNDRKEAQYFEANTDALGGNSGSPVFNHKGEVLGILVRGNDDFYQDSSRNCDRWNTCNAQGNRCDDGAQEEDFDNGMHIQKITPEIRMWLKKAQEMSSHL